MRRAVAEVKANHRRGRRRVYRPWIPEPGMWAQWDWGAGPVIAGRATSLFCAWLAWSRFRVVVPDLGSSAGDGDFLCGPGHAGLRRRFRRIG